MADTRPEGVYCAWKPYGDGFGTKYLVIERVDSLGAVISMEVPEDETAAIALACASGRDTRFTAAGGLEPA